MTVNASNYPQSGEKIYFADNKLIVPDHPIIPYIEGDGTGPDIWKATQKVIDAAVDKAYHGNRKIAWIEVYAGEKANNLFNNWLPETTIQSFREHFVGIKGPLTTPVGEGFRSLNVALRKELDLYVCQRPVQWFNGVPSPVKRPEDVNVVIFRENTEDIYTGIEFEQGGFDNERFLHLLKDNFPQEYTKIRFPDSAGFSIKPISREGTFRLVRAAINWALKNRRTSVTLVHKGNIMKYTEGAFRKWGYELAESEFRNETYTWMHWERTKNSKGEEAANQEQRESIGSGKLLIKDVIADIVFQQVLTRPKEFDVMATPNLNGDYLSDAIAAQVGGIGIAPGGNINYESGTAIFEATHGTAPKYANLDQVNPGSLILSAEMMLRYMGWAESANLIIKGIEGAISAKTVTYDFHRLMEGAILLRTSEFGDAIIKYMD